jgi:monoterpene epsilon-lactone hydrolase
MSIFQREQLDHRLHQPGGAAVPETLEQQRTWFAEFMSTKHVPTELRITDTQLAGRSALLVEPTEGARAGTILYFHGGSYVVGSPQTAVGLTGNLVVRSGYPALSLDYRLAPEHPFPAAVDDAVAAYRELLDLGEPAASIVFAGDSAGGGLAVAACLAARDAGLPLPAGIVGFSAGLDATRTGESMITREAFDPFFTREALAKLGPLYYGDANPDQPLLSPATRADLSGFPPVLLSVGTNEVLLDDSTRFAARAWNHGVDVILDVVAGVPHVFPAYAGDLDEADDALDRVALFLTQRLG